MGIGKYLCRRSMIYYSCVSPRYHHNHKAALIQSFTYLRRAHCYMQASPYSYFLEKPQSKYHGAEEKTKRCLDSMFNTRGEKLHATAKQPFLKSLLASSERDYVISNKGDKVLVDTLEEKTVALYFYEKYYTFDSHTQDMMKVYEELGQNKSSFEVVLVYLYDTYLTHDNTSEECFWNTFKTMPWMALPYKDPKCSELRRYFGYPHDSIPEEPPIIVIVGPSGKFIEPWGADIIRDFKLSAYPFTREKLAKLDTEKVRELKLEMLWDPNTLFRAKDGSKVQFSQLVGKRIILFFEGNDFQQKVVDFLIMLEERYLDLKNTSDEFEVIYITNSDKESPYSEQIPYMQWFVSQASELLPIDRSLYCCYCHLESRQHCLPHRSCRGTSSILAFDRNGRIVRKSLELIFDHFDFPFYAGGLQNEAFMNINRFYAWWWHDGMQDGLLVNAYYRSSNLPFRHKDPLSMLIYFPSVAEYLLY